MRRLLFGMALVLGSGAAQADNALFYVGAGVSQDDFKGITSTASDLNSTRWKIWAAFRPISPFAVEADYIDLGSLTYVEGFDEPSTTHLDYKAFAGYAVGYLPLPVRYLDVFAKAGVARWSSSGSISTPGNCPFSCSSSLSDSGTGFAWGAGAQMHIGNFGGRLEYESFNIANTNGTNVISLSAFLNFY